MFNYAWSLGMGIGPIVALVLLWDDPGSTSFVLTAIGLGVVIVGVYIVSERVEGTALRRDLGLGSRGYAGGLGGGTAALLHDQLDPVRDDLGGVLANEAYPRCSRCPPGGSAHDDQRNVETPSDRQTSMTRAAHGLGVGRMVGATVLARDHVVDLEL